MSRSPKGDERTATLAVVALSTLLSLVIFTIPLTTINAINEALHLSPGEIAWIMSGMPLGCAVGLLTAGALGDTYGRKEVFIGGLLLTIVASVFAALSESGLFLILARVAQGLGSSGVMACGLGLVGQVYQGEERSKATAIWAASLGAGVASGPILASLCLFVGGWSAIHWLAAVTSALLAIASIRVLPNSPRIPERIDLMGSFILMAGMACLLSALTQLRMGLTAATFSMLLASVVLLTAFCFLELRVRNPIIQLDLFKRVDFVGATLAAFASGAGGAIHYDPCANRHGTGTWHQPALRGHHTACLVWRNHLFRPRCPAATRHPLCPEPGGNRDGRMHRGTTAFVADDGRISVADCFARIADIRCGQRHP